MSSLPYQKAAKYIFMWKVTDPNWTCLGRY